MLKGYCLFAMLLFSSTFAGVLDMPLPPAETPLKNIEFVLSLFPDAKNEIPQLKASLFKNYFKPNFPQYFEAGISSFDRLYKLNPEVQKKVFKSFLDFLVEPVHKGEFVEFHRLLQLVEIVQNKDWDNINTAFKPRAIEEDFNQAFKELGDYIEANYNPEDLQENLVKEPLVTELEKKYGHLEVDFNHSKFGENWLVRERHKNQALHLFQEATKILEEQLANVGTYLTDEITGKTKIFEIADLLEMISDDQLVFQNEMGKAKITYVNDIVIKISLDEIPETVLNFHHKDYNFLSKKYRKFLAKQSVSHGGGVSFYDKEVAKNMNFVLRSFYKLKSAYKDMFAQKGGDVFEVLYDDNYEISQKLRYFPRAKGISWEQTYRYFNGKFYMPKLNNYLVGGLVGLFTTATVLGIKHVNDLYVGAGTHLGIGLMASVSAHYLFWSIFSKFDQELKYGGGGLAPNIWKIETLKSIPYYLLFSYFSDANMFEPMLYANMLTTVMGKNIVKLPWKSINDFLRSARLNNDNIKLFGKEIKNYKLSDFQEAATSYGIRMVEAGSLAIGASSVMPDNYKPLVTLGAFAFTQFSGVALAKYYVDHKIKKLEKNRSLTNEAKLKLEKINANFQSHYGLFMNARTWMKKKSVDLAQTIKKLPAKMVIIKPQFIPKSCNRFF